MSLESRRIWVDGELRAWSDVTVHLMAQSLQRGTLVFDVMQAFDAAGGPVILGFREHTERFANSATLNGMVLRDDVDALMGAIGEAVRANPGADLVKICAYYPSFSLDVLPTDEHPTVAIAVFALADVGATTGPIPPAKLQVAASPKMPRDVLSPQVKIAASYTHAAIAKAAARKAGFHDVLFLDMEGNLAESSTQSFFVVKDGEILTPTLDTVLAGVTRSAVIDIAGAEGIPVVERTLSAELIASCDEAFLTGTTINVWPVSHIDGLALPRPVPGAIAGRLAARFEKMCVGGDGELSAKWMQRVF